METMLHIVLLTILLYLNFANGKNFDVIEYGAKGNSKTDDSKAFVDAWTHLCRTSENSTTLTIPANNTFLLQPLVFQGPCKSPFIQFQLHGKIVAPMNKTDWSDHTSQWVSFKDVTGLTVNGSGSINGRGLSFWKPKSSERPCQLHFNRCDNLKIDGITSFDSPRNHISISECKKVEITNVKLIAPEDSPNTDGIDISKSSNIYIHDATIATGDDCVAINSGSVNITIKRIACGPGHGISVGSLGRDGEDAFVENIQVTDCIFNRTQNGARIKTWQGGKGYAKNIIYQNITFIDSKNPIIINQNYIDKGRLNEQEKSSAVAISDVQFINMRGTSSVQDIIKLDCSEVTTCKNIILDKINITTTNGEKSSVDCENVYGKAINSVHIVDCFKNI